MYRQFENENMENINEVILGATIGVGVGVGVWTAGMALAFGFPTLMMGIAQSAGAKLALYSHIPKSKKIDADISKAYRAILKDYKRLKTNKDSDRILLPYFRKVNTKVREFTEIGKSANNVSLKIDKIEKQLKNPKLKEDNKTKLVNELKVLKKEASIMNKRMEKHAAEFSITIKNYYNGRKELNDLMGKKTKIKKSDVIKENEQVKTSRKTRKKMKKDRVSSSAFWAGMKAFLKVHMRLTLPFIHMIPDAIMSFNHTIKDPTKSKIIGKTFISEISHASVVSREKVEWIDRSSKKYGKAIEYEMGLYNNALRDYAASINELTKWLNNNSKYIYKVQEMIKKKDLNDKKLEKAKKDLQILQKQKELAKTAIRNDRKSLDDAFSNLKKKYDQLEK